jgi:Tfp pilus assembly protein PilN
LIKVNLLRNRVQDNTTQMDSGGGARREQLREAFIKLIMIGLFTGGLMMYESQNIKSLQETQARIAAQVQKLQGDNAVKLADVAKVKDVEVQAKELEDKLKILKLLSKLRLREVKTLDFMQSSIPEKVWLKDINYESDKIHVETGHFTFSGNAVATEELTEFVRRLEDSAYLQDVIVIKNQEISINKASSIREFLFTAEVENKN